MRWKTIGAGLLVVVGIGAAGFAVIGPSFGRATATQYLTSQATVTDVVEQVAATGNVEAATTYTLAFGSAPTIQSSSTSTTGSSTGSSSGSSGWTVKSVTVAAGQAVKAGDVLATADATTADLDVVVAEANLASAKARLASDKAGLSATDKAAARLQVTQANQSLSQAQASYSSTVAQNRLKLSQAQAAVNRALSSYNTAKREKQPSSAISQAKSAWTQARESLASLKLQVSQSNRQASNQVSQSKLSVQSAQYAYQQKLAKADAATIAGDQAAVAQAEQAVATAKAALAYTTLASPVDGIVAAVNVSPGLAAPSGAAVSVRSSALQVTASVTESDLPLVVVGQAATVTITALGADVTGTVARIDQVPASANSGVVSYGIVVSLPEAPKGAVPGMSAEIAVTTASATNVLAVPSIALAATTDGAYTVRVLDASGQPASVAVDVGLISSSLAEIKSGISQGTAVVVGTASDRTSSGTTTTTRIPGLDGGGFGGGGFPVRQP
jgi:multidrug efflux pump subunit AcrA (membrane-fusion protein)